MNNGPTLDPLLIVRIFSRVCFEGLSRITANFVLILRVQTFDPVLIIAKVPGTK